MTTHLMQLAPFVPLIALGSALIFAFEIWMIISAAINKGISDKARIWWIVGMLLIHPIVAIVYLCTDYRKRKSVA